jgi:hypothetical protein
MHPHWAAARPDASKPVEIDRDRRFKGYSEILESLPAVMELWQILPDGDRRRLSTTVIDRALLTSTGDCKKKLTTYPLGMGRQFTLFC